jgi:two-component system, NtrC family, response regulator AtoC
VNDEEDRSLVQTETEQGECGDYTRPRATLMIHQRDNVVVVPLERGVPHVIGRGDSSDTVVRDKKISRRHTRVLWTERGCFVEDLGSKNGTLLRGERVTARCRFREGDELSLGSTVIALNVLHSGETSRLEVPGYDHFLERLEQDVVRCSVFRRPMALLMVRCIATGPETTLSLLGHVRERLRPVDYVGVYGTRHLVVAMPEATLELAGRTADVIARSFSPHLPRVVVGLASYPSTAMSADELLSVSREAARQATLDAPVQGLDSSAREEDDGRVILASPEMRRLYELVGRVASTTAPVLIEGETGTGKELVARAIHRESERRTGPFVAVNCGAIPVNLVESTLFGHERGAFTGAQRRHAGYFESASPGTLFLDEVGELPAAVQSALLRVLDRRRIRRVGSTVELEVNVRIVAATHRDLEALVESGEFRQDLLYRLNTHKLEVPPLRERPLDIEPLVEHFLERAARDNGLPRLEIDEAAMAALCGYGWPGNVRELRNVMERAVIVAEESRVTSEELPRRVRGGGVNRGGDKNPFVDGGGFKERVGQYEEALIMAALDQTGGNQTHAAKLLKMPVRTLVYKIKRFGIKWK